MDLIVSVGRTRQDQKYACWLRTDLEENVAQEVFAGKCIVAWNTCNKTHSCAQLNKTRVSSLHKNIIEESENSKKKSVAAYQQRPMDWFFLDNNENTNGAMTGI